MPENIFPDSDAVYRDVRGSVISAQRRVYSAVNVSMVLAYHEIGEKIFLAVGDRAEYGASLIAYLAKRLTKEFGDGFDSTNLRKMRQFYILFPIRDALRLELSWTHYRLLMRVSSEKARLFYLHECAEAGWSTRQLERQISTLYYERLLASRDTKGVAEEIFRVEPKPEYEKIIKDPYVLEFLDLKGRSDWYEKDLEQALIDSLQDFLLELGRGFSFVARQKRISFDDRHFYIDLVFYNYILKCFVLVDLKLGDLTHQDLGQMQMYVNYYTRELMNEGDSSPIGIVLCADKSDAVVKYTLPEGESQVFASKYMLCLPKEEEFAKLLSEWVVREEEVRYERR
ncbi:PDDEXK nuclease domain-containing protein [Methanorbis furvi]|uniref:Nuclease YhcG n=1 Tax=Methanorbis furvi TaxID=3028299 RepID=A0AAE4SAJ2_9EURY|nr:putative nuclease YhcG [Methanocorpusculaceae archaeon Ag1]